jgi:hypothetical protein
VPDLTTLFFRRIGFPKKKKVDKKDEADDEGRKKDSLKNSREEDK